MSASRKADSDAQIILWDSPSTLVFHNTVVTNANVNLSIEFRFGTDGGEARNNLADAPIGTRNGGAYAQSGNYLNAIPAMFVQPISGDLHLLDTTSTRANVIDRVAALAAVPTDIDGEARPAGTAADIGADEFAAMQPVRVAGTPPAYYLTLSDAYRHTGTGGTIEAMEYLFDEDVTLDRPITFTLLGGFDELYQDKSGLSIIKGSLIIKLGSLTIADMGVR
jgi:hypothetical protein